MGTILKDFVAGDLGFVLVGLALAAALGIIGPSRRELPPESSLCRSHRPSVSERAATRAAGIEPIHAGIPRGISCL